MANVVERLERHAADQRRVAHDDDDLLVGTPVLAGEGESLGDAEPRAGVTAVHDVVLTLRAPREPTHAAE